MSSNSGGQAVARLVDRVGGGGIVARMLFLPLRVTEPAPEAVALYERWLSEIEAELARPDCDRNGLCLRVLSELYSVGGTGAGAGAKEAPPGVQVARAQLDPRNVTLEPEYYAEVDRERYARVKPLLWMWQMFDRSPAGQNVHLGVAFRRMLAPHIFKRCGRNFKAFHFVEFSFGYNLEVGDDVVVHRHVLLDDRGGIVLGDRVSIADYANVYSHTHSIVDQRDVTNARTVLEDDVRITYHATVLAGVRVGRNAMVGACAVATRDVRPYHVNVGIPAKSVRVKPGAPSDSESDTTTVKPRVAQD